MSRPGPAPDVLVVGGGAIGFAVADRLAAEGAAVQLVEAEAPAAGASGAAAGMLAPVSEASGDSPALRLGLASLARFEALCARLRRETGVDPELEPSGLVHLAFDDASLEALESKRRALAAGPIGEGCALEPDLRPLSDETLRRSHPGVASDVRGGLWCPQEAHVRPPLLVRALERSARSRGVRVEAGVRVGRVVREPGRVVGVESSAGRLRAGAVVLCAGVATPGLLEASGLAGPDGRGLPIEPVRGQILSLEAPLPAVHSIVWSGGIYFVPKRDGRWVVGATEERVGFDRRVTAGGVAGLLERAMRVFPPLADASFRSAWAGLRPVSADGLPWIGPWPGCEGLLIAAGHGRNGVLLAPETARLVADALQGKVSDDPDARAVRPERLWSH